MHDGLIAAGGTILEIGSGNGTTAIGLALLGAPTGTRVIATDSDPVALQNLRENARANGLHVEGEGADGPAPDAAAARASAGGTGRDSSEKGRTPQARGSLRVSEWDVTSPEAAETVPAAVSELTHIIAADVVYHGGAEPDDGERAAGLVPLLGLLLKQQPELTATLVLVDRFSGGAVGALAAVAGVEHPATALDLAILNFERHCAQEGLVLERSPMPEAVVRRVRASQSPWTRVSWWLAGTWEGLRCYRVRSNMSKMA